MFASMQVGCAAFLTLYLTFAATASGDVLYARIAGFHPVSRLCACVRLHRFCSAARHLAIKLSLYWGLVVGCCYLRRPLVLDAALSKPGGSVLGALSVVVGKFRDLHLL
jgi:hypothetical protein